MTNEQMDPCEPCRDDGLCSACADAPRCAACGEYLPEHEDDCDRGFVAAARECEASVSPLTTACSNCGTCDHRDYACPCGCHSAVRP